MLMNNDLFSRLYAEGSAKTLMPRLICEKAEEFVFQEEANYFENPFSSNDFISMMSNDQ